MITFLRAWRQQYRIYRYDCPHWLRIVAAHLAYKKVRGRL